MATELTGFCIEKTWYAEFSPLKKRNPPAAVELATERTAEALQELGGDVALVENGGSVEVSVPDPPTDQLSEVPLEETSNPVVLRPTHAWD